MGEVDPIESIFQKKMTRRTAALSLGLGVGSALAGAAINPLVRNTIRSIIRDPKMAEIEAKRLKYGIQKHPNLRHIDEFVQSGEIKPQKYDLSCEFASTLYLLNALGISRRNGQPITEDNLIDLVPKSNKPWEGAHPLLRDYLFGHNERIGKLPPNPYGITPEPIARMLNAQILNDTGTKATIYDNKTVHNQQTYTDIILYYLNSGTPLVAWYTTSQDYKSLKSMEIGPDKFVQQQHASLITGIGEVGNATYVEILDPTNPTEYYVMDMDELYDRSTLAGNGLLTIVSKE